MFLVGAADSKTQGMFGFYPPVEVTATIHASLPESYRLRRRSPWADVNRPGDIDSFLEGPCLDDAGNLFVADIPFGRIFRVTPDGNWLLAAEYDGWPCGLKLGVDGSLLVADNRRGILRADPATGSVAPLIETFRSEGFKGVNDLTLASNGDLFFTDQGQTGLQDPTGRVFRFSEGRLDLLLSGIPSPNGLVLNLNETQLYVAVTRANAVWRVPLTPDGGVTKVGSWLQLSGGLAGPDGLALDEEGGVIVAHPGTGVWRFDAFGQPTHAICAGTGAFITNIAFGGADNRTLFMTESARGLILSARMPYAGRRPLRLGFSV